MLKKKHKQTTKHSHIILKELMHGHGLMLIHVYPSSHTRHMHLGDIPRGLDTKILTLRPLGEACQIGSDGIYHLHHIPQTGINFSPFWLLGNPIPFAISQSSWSLDTCILQCLKLMAIMSGVSLNSTMMAEMLSLWTSL